MSKRLNDHLAMVWNWGDFITEDTSPRIVDTRTDELVCTLAGHTDYVRDALLFEDGMLATWSSDKTVRLWRLDGSCTAVLEGMKNMSPRSAIWAGAGLPPPLAMALFASGPAMTASACTRSNGRIASIMIQPISCLPMAEGSSFSSTTLSC